MKRSRDRHFHSWFISWLRHFAFAVLADVIIWLFGARRGDYFLTSSELPRFLINTWWLWPIRVQIIPFYVTDYHDGDLCSAKAWNIELFMKGNRWHLHTRTCACCNYYHFRMKIGRNGHNQDHQWRVSETLFERIKSHVKRILFSYEFTSEVHVEWRTFHRSECSFISK